jgi:hypothetical protein
MTLRRTPAGLTSLHLFFKVDVVVYCEGGNSIPEAAVAQGAGNEETLDSLFWRRISQFVGAIRTYHFKSVGSKVTLASIAQDVQSLQIASIIVCLDRDYDWHCSKQITLAHVVYTYGYSWENDVSNNIALERVFFRFVARSSRNERLFEVGQKTIARFAKEVAVWCQAEISLHGKSAELVFPRNKPLAMIQVGTDGLPELCIARLKQRLHSLGYERKPHMRIRISHSESLRHSWGKLVAHYFYHLAIKLANKCDTDIRLTCDAFMRLLMADMMEGMKEGALPELASYYRGLSTIFR